MEIHPSQTVYINNINEKVKKDVLKRMLHMIFSQYGKVIEIVACKGLKLRGQAWVVFEDAASATNAIRGKQGYNFYGKPLKIAYAKAKSHIIARKEGTMVEGKVSTSLKRTREPDFSEDMPASKKFDSGESSRNVLFAQNLPSHITSEALSLLFQQYPGFTEVRLPSGRPGIAFIQFSDEIQASVAMRSLQGFQLTPSDVLQLSLSQ